MTRILVLADDLTGANATAAGFARAGLRAVTVGLGRGWGAVAEFQDRFDVVVVTTESRHASPEDVAEAVTLSVRAGWPVDLVSCRVDSTLRGNVGIASETLLRAVEELSGRRTVGLCLPAHPRAGRQTVDGFQLLHGSRLEDTELAHDPRSPVRDSGVADVLRRATSLRTAHVPLASVTADGATLEAALRDGLEQEADVVIGDALTEDHLARLGRAAVAVGREQDVDWVGVDPGPGSLALVAAMGVRGHGQGGPVLAVSGSATGLTRRQLQTLVNARTVHLVRPARRAGSVVPDPDAAMAELVKVDGAAKAGEVVLVATALTESDVVPLRGDDGAALPAALGQLTRRVLQECVVDGLYTTGGDVTAAVLDELQTRGLEVDDEVVPLAVSGEIVGGPWSGLPIVTKGGLVGDPDTAVACIDHLTRAGAARARRAQAACPTRRPNDHARTDPEQGETP